MWYQWPPGGGVTGYDAACRRVLMVWICIVSMLAMMNSKEVVMGQATCVGDDHQGEQSSGSCALDSMERLPKRIDEWLAPIPKIQYEGESSKNPFSFKFYNASEVIMGKKMSEWLKFSLAFWHTMRGDGSDPFGAPTKLWPWEDSSLDAIEMATIRLEVFFTIMNKLGIEYWCFHDRDISPEMDSLAESNAALDKISQYAHTLQNKYGVKLLWGTSQLFKHRRYMHGAATSPNATVFAWAAGQAKKAMDVVKKLDGQAFVFWGGREGYSTLLNTDLAFEQSNQARFLRLAARYAKKIKFKGPLLLEPKPQEPAKHQYDFDAATTHAFLLRHKLLNEGNFGLNIECNHATLAGHSCFHELTYASEVGLLSSIDINSGDPQVGWDTDQFLTDPKEATLVALAILKQNGLEVGLNFDAKLRRESIAIEDIIIAHIAGMDSMARGIRNAAALIKDGRMDALKKSRYSSYYATDLGKSIVNEKVSFDDLSNYALSHEDPGDNMSSGQQELYERLLDMHVH